jgi:hypothetical protein
VEHPSQYSEETWQRDTANLMQDASDLIAKANYAEAEQLLLGTKHLQRDAPEEFASLLLKAQLEQQLPRRADTSGSSSAPQPPVPEPARLAADQGPTHVEAIAEHDALDRASITYALSKLLTQRKDTAPLSIGLFGHWGSGKSSQVAFVKRELAALGSPRFVHAEFNAWKHEKTDNIGAALAQSVVDSLVGEMGFLEKLILAAQMAARRRLGLKRSLTKDLSSSWSWLRFSPTTYAPLIVWPGLAAMLAFGTIGMANLSSIFTTLGTAAIGLSALWVSWHKFISENLTSWFKRVGTDDGRSPFALPDYAAKLGSFHDINRTLEDLCALCLMGSPDAPSKGDYLLVFVDDLDRCMPGTVKQVFDAVRLVTNIPRVIVLLAIDERIAFATVEKHFYEFGFAGREPSQVARDYLAKVFQISITLPAVDARVTHEYVTTRLFANMQPPPSQEQTEISTQNADADYQAQARQPAASEPILVSEPEIMLFAQLASETRIHNPRELWRLKQAWLLLKGMRLSQDADFASLEGYMRHLFVREKMLQAQASDISEELLAILATRAGLPGSISRAREEFDAHDSAVRCVLLPAAHRASQAANAAKAIA